MAGSGFDRPVLPARRVVVGSLVGAVASGALLGLVLGILAPFTPGDGKVLAAVTGSPTTAAAATQRSSAAPPTAGPSTSRSQAVRTVTKAPAAAPDQFVQHPENDRTMTLGILQSVDPSNPGSVTVWMVRAKIITGADAQQYYQSQGQQPRNSAVVPVDNAQPVGFALRQDASLWGLFLLGDHQNINPRRLRTDEFVQAAFGALSRGEHPAIWVKRAFGARGDAVYVAEQVVQ